MSNVPAVENLVPSHAHEYSSAILSGLLGKAKEADVLLYLLEHWPESDLVYLLSDRDRESGVCLDRLSRLRPLEPILLVVMGRSPTLREMVTRGVCEFSRSDSEIFDRIDYTMWEECCPFGRSSMPGFTRQVLETVSVVPRPLLVRVVRHGAFPDLVPKIIEKGGDPFIRDSFGDNAIIAAVELGQLATLQTICEAVDQIAEADLRQEANRRQNGNGPSVLYLAARSLKPDILSYLVERFPFDGLWKGGREPMSVMVLRREPRNRDEEVAKQMVLKTLFENDLEKERVISFINRDPWVRDGSSAGSIRRAFDLLKAKDNFSAVSEYFPELLSYVDQTTGMTLAMTMASSLEVEKLKVILQLCPQELTKLDSSGKSLVHWALLSKARERPKRKEVGYVAKVREQLKETIRLLIDLNAPLNSLDESGKTPLAYADLLALTLKPGSGYRACYNMLKKAGGTL